MIDNMNGQYNIKVLRVLAYIPNLSAGKGTDKKKNSGALNQRDFHKNVCLLQCHLLENIMMLVEYGGLTPLA